MNRYSRLKEEWMLTLCWTILKPSKPEDWNIHLYDPTPIDQASNIGSDNMIEFTFPKKPADVQVIVQFFPHATDDIDGIQYYPDANNIGDHEIPDNLIPAVDDFFKKLIEMKEIDPKAEKHAWTGLWKRFPLPPENKSGCASVIFLLIISAISFLWI